MNLEVGKVYLMSNGKPARCICTDRGRGPDYLQQAVFLMMQGDGREDLHVTNNDGTAFRGSSFKVVKEYVPPIRVRVVTVKTTAGVLTFSATDRTDTRQFNDPKYPAGYRGHTGCVVVDDRIFEVEDK